MLDLRAVRTTIAAHLEAGKPDSKIAKVYPLAITGTLTLPAAVVGLPAIDDANYQPCLQLWTLPVHVVVARPGIDEEQTVQQLEDAWQAVYRQLETLTDDGIAGTTEARLTRAEFGSVLVAGQAYPAYEITLELLG